MHVSILNLRESRPTILLLNEFYLNYKVSKSAYANYQHEVEEWNKFYNNVLTEIETTETMTEKLARLQKDAENSRQCDVSFKERGAR